MKQDDPKSRGEVARELKSKLRKGERQLSTIRAALEYLIDIDLPSQDKGQPFRYFEEVLDELVHEHRYNSFSEFCDGYLCFPVKSIKALFKDDPVIMDLIDHAVGDGRSEGNNLEGANQYGDRREVNLYNIQANQKEEAKAQEAPTGTSSSAGLRRLRTSADPKAKPLHKAVLAGEMSVNAACVEMGWRPRMLSIPVDPERAARSISNHFSAEQIAELITHLKEKKHGV